MKSFWSISCVCMLFAHRWVCYLSTLSIICVWNCNSGMLRTLLPHQSCLLALYVMSVRTIVLNIAIVINIASVQELVQFKRGSICGVGIRAIFSQRVTSATSYIAWLQSKFTVERWQAHRISAESRERCLLAIISLCNSSLIRVHRLMHLRNWKRFYF